MVARGLRNVGAARARFRDDEDSGRDGWSVCAADPMKVVAAFPRLRLKPGYVLRAYQFRSGGNGNAVVWAQPAGASFPEPDDPAMATNSIGVAGIVLDAPRPPEAVDDFMEAIEGDRSALSFLSASLLWRQLRELGATWHGEDWSTHALVDETLGIPTKRGDYTYHPIDESELRWDGQRPVDWQPLVEMLQDGGALVTFYTRSDLGCCTIYEHRDRFPAHGYVCRSSSEAIATGPGGFVF